MDDTRVVSFVLHHIRILNFKTIPTTGAGRHFRFSSLDSLYEFLQCLPNATPNPTMRLLHAETLEFGEFFDSEIPPYVILSHVWGKDEVSYQMFLERHDKKYQEILRRSAGYRKILDFCKYGPEVWLHEYCLTANNSVVRWVWIDTCCIDKKSSAELSEAINSMFKWYQNARLCCVHLPDFGSWHFLMQDNFALFEASKWFRQGWTLQELIAPRHVEFFDQFWRILGHKDLPYRPSDTFNSTDCLDGRYLFAQGISRASGIDQTHIESVGTRGFRLDEIPVATRMAWAAGRETSRTEDIAYCLLGLFDVNMPLLYGEGMKAFRRLQEGILCVSPDESIFVRSGRNPQRYAIPSSGSVVLNHLVGLCGVLAESPGNFSSSSNITVGLPEPLQRWGREIPVSITNFGLQIEVKYVVDPSEAAFRYVLLDCHDWRAQMPYFLKLWRSPESDERYGLRRNTKWLKAVGLQGQTSSQLPPRLIQSFARGELAFQNDTIFMEL